MVSARNIKKTKIGFMQGRLVPSEKKGRIQYFPYKNWKKEILIAKKNKFSLMEWTVNIENYKKNPIFLDNQILKLKKFLKKKKIKIHSVTCDFFMQRPFFKNSKNQFVLNILKKLIKNGQKLGIKFFIVPLVDQSSLKSVQQENLLIKEMKKFNKYLNSKSQILFEIDYKPNKILKFMKKFKNPKFGINYDTGNSAGMGYNFYDEKFYFKYVKNIHIKDKKVHGKTVRLGEGDFDFKSFFNYIKRINYKGNFILQTARSKNNNHLRELNKNRGFVAKFL